MKPFLYGTLLFLLITSVLLAFGKASVRGNARPNSVGVSETYQNPNTYLIALPIDGQILSTGQVLDRSSQFTNIRFSPLATAALYDETVLFCGDVTPMFKDKQGTVALVYRTQASGKFQGIGCHDLLGVYEIKEGDLQ